MILSEAVLLLAIGVGYDLEADRARGWHVTETGIVVIGRGYSSVPTAVMIA